MNPNGLNPPPSLRRTQLSTLFLLGSLAVFFLWFFWMRLQDQYSTGIVEQGVTALTKKDVPRAKSFFDTYIRANSTNPQAYLNIANICVGLDQPTLGIDYVQRGLDACKKAPDAQRAGLYLGLSEAQALAEPRHPQTLAIASARTALSLDPQNALMKNAVGYTLADNDQNLEEAEKLLREALQSLQPSGSDPDPLRPVVEDSFGWLLYKKGDYAGAVTELSQATQDMPSGEPGFDAKYYYYHLGAAYRKAGQIDDARRTLDIALQYDPNFLEAKAEAALLPPPNTPASVPSSIGTPPANTSPAASPSSAPGLKL